MMTRWTRIVTDEYAPYVRLQMQAAAAWQRGDFELAGELHAAAVEAAKAADVQIDRKLGKEPYDPTPFNYEAWARDRGGRER